MFDFLNPYMIYLKIAAAVGLVAVGAYGGYRFELGRYNALVAADAKAMTVAVKVAADKQHRIDLGNQGDAVAQAYLSGKLDAVVLQINLGAPSNVTIAQDAAAASADRAGCITFGFVRLLVAGERIVSPDSLDYPGGQSADACTALKPSELATAVAADLAAGQGNAGQLNSLIAAVKRNDAIAVAPK